MLTFRKSFEVISLDWPNNYLTYSGQIDGLRGGGDWGLQNEYAAYFSHKLAYGAPWTFPMTFRDINVVCHWAIFSGDDDIVPFWDVLRCKYLIDMTYQHAILFKNERETSWWKLHVATVNSIRDIGSLKWKSADFAEIWPFTSQNWVSFWPGIKNCTTNQEYSSRAIRCFAAKLYVACFETSWVGSYHPPPLPGRVIKKGRARARYKRSLLVSWLSIREHSRMKMHLDYENPVCSAEFLSYFKSGPSW